MVEVTVSDWITRASQANAREEVARCLQRAEATAESCPDWRSLAAAYRDHLSDAMAALRCASAAVDRDPGQIWAYHELALVLRDQLGDAEGARGVFQRAETTLATLPEAQVYMWRFLAEWYRSVLDDADAARGALEKGLARSVEVADLCDMAGGHAGILGETDRARELLGQAEEVAEKLSQANRDRGESDGSSGAHCWWTIANTYKNALNDPGRARDSFQRGFALVGDVAGCLTMVRAYHSHYQDDRDTLRRYLARGRELAMKTEHWIELAAAYHEFAGDPGWCRRCLEEAEKHATDEERRRVAHGHRHWLEDPETADRVAPRGVAPAELTGKDRKLAGWHGRGDPAALLDWLRARLTPEILQSIASADYGWDAEANLACLHDIVESGLVPAPMDSSLHEVMALCRWSEGESVEHVERAFACVMLCLDVVHIAGYTESVSDTLAPLVESCVELGEEAVTRLVGLLVWLIEAEFQVPEGHWDAVGVDDAADSEGAGDEDAGEGEGDDDDDSGDLLAVHHALLLAQVVLDSRDERLSSLVRVIVELEARLAGAGYWIEPERGWFCRVICSLRDGMWRSLTRRILHGALVDRPGLAHLQEVADLMTVEP